MLWQRDSNNLVQDHGPGVPAEMLSHIFEPFYRVDDVQRVANELRNLGVRVFYDRYEQAQLWGKDLYA